MIMSRVAGALMAESGDVNDEALREDSGSKCPNYNLEDPARRIWVFTTASLPWMTGTAVNPLLRAAYLTRGREKGKITLGVPWLLEEDQDLVYPKGKRYATKEDQAAYVREWLVKAGLEEESEKLDLLFYPARYHSQFGSIFPMGDLAAQVPDAEADVAVLEEPEHLNFFRAEGVPWLKKFDYVVGIIHTNYQFYARGEKHGRVKKPIVKAACAFTVRAHCHRVIKLSDTLQEYAWEKEMVENVHGVRPQFLEVGDEAHKKGFTEDAYFIGKVLWTKGIDILLALMHNARSGGETSSNDDGEGGGSDDAASEKAASDAPATAAAGDSSTAAQDGLPSPPPTTTTPPTLTPPAAAGEEAGEESGADGGGEAKPFPITIYGNGSDLEEVKAKVEEMDLPVAFHDAIDHAELGQYKVFVNPSQSEVLCTTIAEALAMGKWVVCARHPSNEFFFTNFETCLSFGDEKEFLSCMRRALSEDPPVLAEETRHKLSWAAATDRFLAAASRPEVPGRSSSSKSARGLARLDKLLAALHQQTMKGRRGDLLRKALGGGPVAKQNSYTKKTAAAAAAAAAAAEAEAAAATEAAAAEATATDAAAEATASEPTVESPKSGLKGSP